MFGIYDWKYELFLHRNKFWNMLINKANPNILIYQCISNSIINLKSTNNKPKAAKLYVQVQNISELNWADFSISVK